MIDPVTELEKLLYRQATTQARLSVQIGISAQYLSEIMRRSKPPSAAVLSYLGLERFVVYRRVTP